MDAIPGFLPLLAAAAALVRRGHNFVRGLGLLSVYLETVGVGFVPDFLLNPETDQVDPLILP
jgi:hypothetical protein